MAIKTEPRDGASARVAVAITRQVAWLSAIGIVVGVLSFVLLAIFTGLVQAPWTTPRAQSAASTAADPSPLSLAASQPIQHARDARLPPLLGTGSTVSVHLIATDATVDIASGVGYKAWTFNGTVPAPILHVRQGQTVHVTLTNEGTMPHSIDFHAAQVAPNEDFREVNPGQSFEFSFVASTPGAFLYHCGTPPTLLHLANGMYGAIIVDPAIPLPPATASYVLVQGEWYTSLAGSAADKLMVGDWSKMLTATPDEVVFNGTAFQYRDHPLTARAGQRVRLYVVNVGPSLTSAFHVIGALFAAVYPDGDPSHVETGVSVYPVAPGQGVVLDLIIPHPGKYPFLDHSMRDMQLGAMGLLDVSQ